MKLMTISAILILFLVSCATSKKEWANFNKNDCAKYQYGRIDAKRLLSEVEKKNLSASGIQIQEFIFETQYLGSWERKWSNTSLEKLPVRALIPFSAQDKISSGVQIKDVKILSETPGQSMVLIQTIATVDTSDLKQFGQVVFSRDFSYRMMIDHNKLMELLEFPCLKLMSIVKENYEPDK